MKKIENLLSTPENVAVTPFDAADYLTNDEIIVGYLEEALADPDPDMFLSALGDVLKAKGVANIAKATGLAREGLYRTCQPGKKPEFDTVVRILRAVGLTISFGCGPTVAETAKARKPPAVKRRGKRAAKAVEAVS